MSPTHLAPTVSDSPARPSTPLRRALGFEWRQHRDVLAFHGVIATILVLLASFLDIRLGVVLILLAARLPADLADKRPEDGRMLRSSLGISRADAVRARFLVVTGGQLLLAIGAAWIILVTGHGREYHWSTVGADSGQHWLTLGDQLVDIALWSGAIAWAHALIGGETFRLGTRPTGRRAIALFFGVWLVEHLVLFLAHMLGNALASGVDIDGLGRWAMAGAIVADVVAAAALGAGLAALLWTRRRWLRRA